MNVKLNADRKAKIMLDLDDFIVCTKCRQNKKPSSYYVNVNRPNGKQAECKDCQKDTNKKHAFEKKQRMVEYKGGKCARCNGVFHPFVYDFHHIDPSTKEKSLNSMRYLSWDRIKEELDKCEILCANCHRLTHVEANQ